MFIIFIAHLPDNTWTLWIPARFGFSDATGTPTPSLGLTIVNGLVRQLHGRIRAVQDNGVAWEARFPAPDAA